MNGKQIADALNSHVYTPQIFCEVFSCDRAPWLLDSLPAAMVENTEDSSKAGSHWIVVFFSKSTRSYRNIRFVQEKANFLQLDPRETCRGSKAHFLQRELQSNLSTVYEQYCIIIILRRCLDKCCSYIIHLVTDNHQSNVTRACEYISQHFEM